jgi:hypothetical protein
VSYVTLLEVKKTGEVENYAEIGNNHGFAPLVWDYFSKKFNTYSGPYSVMMDEPALKKTWKLFNSGKLDRLDNILLGATFDRVWVKREHLPAFIEALERFHAAYILPGNFVRTANGMAIALKKFYEEEPESLGIALDQCSANESWWTKRIPLGDDGEPLTGNGEAVDYDHEPLNILKDELVCDGKPHWELGEALK